MAQVKASVMSEDNASMGGSHMHTKLIELATGLTSRRNVPLIRSIGVITSLFMPNSGSDLSKLSFWINAYNIAAVKTIIDYAPKYSIRDIGNVFKPVWDHKVLPIGDDRYSLDKIKSKILIPMGDARVHFALVCGALSCPNLPKQAFTFSNIEFELEQQTLKFLGDRSKGLNFCLKYMRQVRK